MQKLLKGDEKLMMRRGFGDNFGDSDKKAGPGFLQGPLFFWWALQDSNLRPADYESAALTN